MIHGIMLHTCTPAPWRDGVRTFFIFIVTHMIVLTSTLYYVLYSGTVNLALCHKMFQLLASLCNAQDRVHQNMTFVCGSEHLFLHGMSCDTLISHPGCLRKTAASVRGMDCHSQHTMDWVIHDLHLVTRVFHYHPNPYSPMLCSARPWDLTINPCHFTL